MVNPFQPVLHDWCNKGHGMYYPVCEVSVLLIKQCLFESKVLLALHIYKKA